MNFIIRIYSQSDTICSFVEPFLTTYSTESSDFGNYEIHSVEKIKKAQWEASEMLPSENDLALQYGVSR